MGNSGRLDEQRETEKAQKLRSLKSSREEGGKIEREKGKKRRERGKIIRAPLQLHRST